MLRIRRDLDDRKLVARLQFLRERFSLRHGPRISVQDETPNAIFLLNTSRHDPIHDGIGHKFSCSHQFLRGLAVGRILGDFFTQHIAGGDLRDAQTTHDLFRLRALTRSRMTREGS